MRPDRYDGDPDLDRLERTVAGLDGVVEMAVTAAREKIGEPTCAGCRSPGCCYQRVSVTLAEALPIARRLISRGFDSPGVRRRLAGEGEEMSSRTPEEWWALSRPCFFLGEGRCSIYDVRPVACRARFSWSDPELCQPPAVSDVVTVDMVGAARAVVQLNLELCRGLGLNDVVTYAGAMPRMVAVALEALSRDTAAAVEYLWGLEFPIAGR